MTDSARRFLVLGLFLIAFLGSGQSVPVPILLDSSGVQPIPSSLVPAVKALPIHPVTAVLSSLDPNIPPESAITQSNSKAPWRNPIQELLGSFQWVKTGKGWKWVQQKAFDFVQWVKRNWDWFKGIFKSQQKAVLAVTVAETQTEQPVTPTKPPVMPPFVLSSPSEPHRGVTGTSGVAPEEPVHAIVNPIPEIIVTQPHDELDYNTAAVKAGYEPRPKIKAGPVYNADEPDSGKIIAALKAGALPLQDEDHKPRKWYKHHVKNPRTDPLPDKKTVDRMVGQILMRQDAAKACNLSKNKDYQGFYKLKCDFKVDGMGVDVLSSDDESGTIGQRIVTAQLP